MFNIVPVYVVYNYNINSLKEKKDYHRTVGVFKHINDAINIAKIYVGEDTEGSIEMREAILDGNGNAYILDKNQNHPLETETDLVKKEKEIRISIVSKLTPEERKILGINDVGFIINQ